MRIRRLAIELFPHDASISKFLTKQSNLFSWNFHSSRNLNVGLVDGFALLLEIFVLFVLLLYLIK